MPLSIRLRKSTEISSSSANSSWLIFFAKRSAFKRLPNFSRRPDKYHLWADFRSRLRRGPPNEITVHFLLAEDCFDELMVGH